MATVAEIPPIMGLILVGGKSTRMGRDKSLLDYHGLPQRDYLSELLQPFCAEVYLSCRAEQTQELSENYSVIADNYSDWGPFGGLLSAFEWKADVAWLLIACDLPFVDAAALKQLLEHRQPTKFATAFLNTQHNFPEPLCTIWEPFSYPSLQTAAEKKQLSLKWLLEQADIQLLTPFKPGIIENVNTMDAYRKIVTPD